MTQQNRPDRGDEATASGFDPSRDDMVFRVAREIARSNVLSAEPQTGRLSETGIEQLVEYFSTKCIPEARGAIAAMREPTAAMCEVGPYINEVNPNCPPITTTQAEACWQAMIDTALAQAIYTQSPATRTGEG